MSRSALAFLVAAIACGGLDDVDFTRSARFTIPGSPSGGTGGTIGGLATVDLGGEDALRDQGIDPDDIDSARPRSLRVQVLQGASLETWLDEVVLRARAEGLPDVVVAEKRGIRAMPAGTRVLELDVRRDVDLKPYLTGTAPTLGVEAAGIPPVEDTTAEITATIRVDVNVSGLLD
ncbi:hypothetical protein [Anaeromyxobacter sp. Fw109-5]|uniref:hypothetical protein n=1 Tax=Anaeromyxobacter sp. (strain Fw109-5) TaxID=404589 RepID=UPI000158A8AB|nr:hypothetical protein [Anaeromyxobacter sp. Fw109-5]ABS28075.1 hypothetical protein Anae109_3896 [Anaeromyxobacter sp. Fw109-5]